MLIEMDYLLDKGIPCAIYYPIPLHSQKHIWDSDIKKRIFRSGARKRTKTPQLLVTV
jgi:hypothetical protein